MDLCEILFKRTLVKELRNGQDEEKLRIATRLTVTKEVNGYALWYSSQEIWPGRIVAWSQYAKDDIIAYAARMSAQTAKNWAEKSEVDYAVPRLDDEAEEPVPAE